MKEHRLLDRRDVEQVTPACPRKHSDLNLCSCLLLIHYSF